MMKKIPSQNYINAKYDTAENQFLLPGMMKSFWLYVTSRNGLLLVFINDSIPSKYNSTTAQATCFFCISTSRSKLR